MTKNQLRIIKILIANERDYYEAKLRGEPVLERDIWWEAILPGDQKTVRCLQDRGLVETETRNETQLHARLVEEIDESEL